MVPLAVEQRDEVRVPQDRRDRRRSGPKRLRNARADQPVVVASVLLGGPVDAAEPVPSGRVHADGHVVLVGRDGSDDGHLWRDVAFPARDRRPGVAGDPGVIDPGEAGALDGRVAREERLRREGDPRGAATRSNRQDRFDASKRFLPAERLACVDDPP